MIHAPSEIYDSRTPTQIRTAAHRSSFAAAIVLGLFLSLILGEGSVADDKKPADQKTARPKITISKKTTRITNPRANDGFVDYLAAWNARAGAGIKPESNAAVMIWTALGPAPIPVADREPFFRMLGIGALPDDGAYFQTLDAYATGEDGKPAAELRQMLLQAMHKPWSEAHFPRLLPG